MIYLLLVLVCLVLLPLVLFFCGLFVCALYARIQKRKGVPHAGGGVQDYLIILWLAHRDINGTRFSLG